MESGVIKLPQNKNQILLAATEILNFSAEVQYHHSSKYHQEGVNITFTQRLCVTQPQTSAQPDQWLTFHGHILKNVFACVYVSVHVCVCVLVYIRKGERLEREIYNVSLIVFNICDPLGLYLFPFKTIQLESKVLFILPHSSESADTTGNSGLWTKRKHERVSK